MTWLNDLLDKYGRLQLWREAVQTSDLQKSLEFSRQTAAAGMEKFAGLKTQPTQDDDMVNLGNITVQQPQKSGELLKLLFGTALLGTTSLGTGFLGYLIATNKAPEPPQVIVEQPPAVVQPPPEIPQDTDTQYDLRLGKDE